MAKSLRSKWKRKMRAVKRERYGKKELEKLKTVLGINKTEATDVEMGNIQDVVTVVSKNDIQSKEESMDDDRRVHSSKTLRDQYGNYPVWLSSRKIKKVTKRNRRVKKATKKKEKNAKKKARK